MVPRVGGRQMPRQTMCEGLPAGATGRVGLRGAAGCDLEPVPRDGARALPLSPQPGGVRRCTP